MVSAGNARGRHGSMRRALSAWRWCLSIGVVLLAAGVAAAQGGAWPDYPFSSPHALPRGPGFYFSWIKLGLLWALFLGWVKTTDWVSQDTQIYGFPYSLWNPIVFFPFLVGLLAFGLSLPMFVVGYGLTVLCWAVPLLVYIVQRNQRLEPHERVLTPSHLRHLLAEGLGKAGVKISAERKAAHEKGAPVNFTARGGGDEQSNQASLVSARQSKGFRSAKETVANAVDHRAEKIMLDYAPDSVSTRYQVDGVWHDADALERSDADEMLLAFKRLCALNPDERRKRQQGKFGAEYQDHKMDGVLVCQGTKTGERVLIHLTGSKSEFHTLQELGMRDKTIEKLKELMLADRGVLVFSAMPGNGLTTTLAIALNSTDRLLRDFVAVESKHAPLPEVENVDPVFYDPAKGESPASLLDAISRKQPDVIVVPDLPNAESVIMLCDISATEHLAFATIQAKEAVEALLRVLLLKVPAKTFAPVAIGVLNQRLIRKLCEDCKEAYTPPPALLQKLGIPADRIDQLFRHPENPEEVCKTCHGIGYLGRTAIYELLVVDDTIREVLMQQPKLDILRKAARRGGNRTLQEEGILAVIRGTTSLPELMRVLKQ